MAFVKSPYLIKNLSRRNLIWEVRTQEKNIFLTFDDGPIPEVTPWVLKTLDDFHAKATFFCVGENIQKHPEIFELILKKGHIAGNHSYNHLSGWKLLSKNYLENIRKCSDVIDSGLFRPPYGRITPTQIARLRKEYSIVLWSVLSGDYDHRISREKCLNNVLGNAKKGSIVVFHDSLKARHNLQYVLPRVLEYFSQRGFAFKSLSKELCSCKHPYINYPMYKEKILQAFN